MQNESQTLNCKFDGEYGASFHCTFEVQCTASVLSIYHKYAHQISSNSSGGSGEGEGGKGCLRVYLVSLRKRNFVHYGSH